jgi:hypothetical protein
MPPALIMALLITLAALLAAVSALAGALWWRVRNIPTVHAAHLAKTLAERQEVLETLIARLEAASKPKAKSPIARRFPDPSTLTTTHRVDTAETTMPPGPTLIAVPNIAGATELPASPPKGLTHRFSPIWELADKGASAEAIARVTGQPVGQVELILGLRRQLLVTEGRS